MLGFDALSNLSKKQMRVRAFFNYKKMKALYSSVQEMDFLDAFDQYMFPSLGSSEEVSLCRMVSKFILNPAQSQQALEEFLDAIEDGKDDRTFAMCSMLAHTVLSIADRTCPDLVKISDKNASMLKLQLSRAQDLKDNIDNFYADATEEKILAKIKDFKSCAEINDSIIINSQNIASLYLHLDMLLRTSINYTDNLLADALDFAEMQSPVVEMSDDLYDRMMNEKKSISLGLVMD